MTRPATHGELRRARHRVPLAANADRTRLLAVHGSRSASGALHALRRRLDTRLPIDVLTTHYPDRHRQVLLNVDLGDAVHEVLCRDAAALGLRPRDVLSQRLRAAVARDTRERARRLEQRLASVLASHTPEEILAGVAHLLLRPTGRCTPPAP